MRKERILKRLFLGALLVLSVRFLAEYAQEMLQGRFRSRGLLLLIPTLGVAEYFIHPDKFEWKQLKQWNRSYFGILFLFGGIAFALVVLALGWRLGQPENWKQICAAGAGVALLGFLLLYPEHFRRKKGAKGDANVQQSPENKQD